MTSTQTTIRPVEPRDLAAICRHRRNMFAANNVANAILDQMDAPFAAWLAPRLASGEYFGFVAEDHDAIIAGVGLFVINWPPHPSHPTATQRGYILNVYVEPSHRSQGLSAELMRRAEEEFQSRGITYIVLHASAMGRPVYEKLGWTSTSEMSKFFPGNTITNGCCS